MIYPCSIRVKQMGFDAIEIIPFDVEKFPAKKVRQATADLGLIVNTGFGMPERYNIISPDPVVRRAGVEFSKRLIDLSNDAGARVFGGMIYCGWGYLTGKRRSADEWKWGVENYREIASYAQQASELILGIEPVNRFESHFINTAADGPVHWRSWPAECESAPRHVSHDSRRERFRVGGSRDKRAARICARVRKPARYTRVRHGAVGPLLRKSEGCGL
jgi:Xylose isomerase-like TIM barrel